MIGSCCTDDIAQIVGFPLVAVFILLFSLNQRKGIHTGQSSSYLANRIPIRIILIGWLFLSSILSIRGYYSTSHTLPIPNLAIGFLLPLFISLAFFRLSFDFRTILTSTPLYILVGVQAYRGINYIYLKLLYESNISTSFALFFGISGALLGILALVCCFFLYTQHPKAQQWTKVWNIIGLCLAVLEISLILIPLVDLKTIKFFPFSLIPTYIIPIGIFFHVVIYSSLKKNKI
ncbi:MAG: hypothetical protein ACI86H_000208 [bacterium]|jgi:hypothetical protein